MLNSKIQCCNNRICKVGGVYLRYQKMGGKILNSCFMSQVRRAGLEGETGFILKRVWDAGDKVASRTLAY